MQAIYDKDHYCSDQPSRQKLALPAWVALTPDGVINYRLLVGGLSPSTSGVADLDGQWNSVIVRGMAARWDGKSCRHCHGFFLFAVYPDLECSYRILTMLPSYALCFPKNCL